MLKTLIFTFYSLLALPSHAWGVATGKIDVVNVNTYGNYSANHLNGGYCFKLIGFDFYFKVAYFDSGEQKNNLLLVQSMVLAASMADRGLKVTYVDWGTDPTCRVNGTSIPAKWVENLQVQS